MAKLSKKEYLEIAKQVGLEKMKAIEEESGVSTGLLDSSNPPAKSKKPQDSKLTVSLDCTKEELLQGMREQGCTIADYNIVKFGEPDYVLFDNKETKVQTEQIVALHEQVADYLIKSLENALKIGEILFDLKENHIKRGKFGLWMKQNLPFSERTGQRYMQVYLYREDLAKKEISSLADAYRELNGDPLDDEALEIDDGTNTKRNWEVVAASVTVDNLNLPKKKLKGLQKTFQVTSEIVDCMEQGLWPFNGKYAKIVSTIPSDANRKSLLCRYVIAADNLLVPGGKLIFVKRKQ